jgi:hypothetical protein
MVTLIQAEIDTLHAGITLDFALDSPLRPDE